jgi:hypothetical protein
VRIPGPNDTNWCPLQTELAAEADDALVELQALLLAHDLIVKPPDSIYVRD